MAILKCKMCGDNIEVSSDKTYGTCESCGSTMTLPKIDDDQKVNLYNRANHFRRQNEFDKALAVYEKLIEQDDNEAEAHWGAVLCRYGIEYVEDPATHERIPTCHRASYDSILQDVDYLAALKYSADAVTKSIYEKEATYIAGVQKGIISISQKEKPYDVFICYKETDPSGSRTQDSTLAQDVYYQLTNEGFKVFFSRITLEDKLGQAYEPYIFAALNSAKVMVIIGTQPEYYSAVWVKNEWSRYLNLLKKDKSRLLIPCYRGMDAYELPEELSMLQSQDMGKIGFIQDLIRGIKKVLVKEEAPVVKVVETVNVGGGYAANVESLLKRIQLFLEDGEWDNVKEYCDKVLDIDAECAMAYVYRLCAKLECKTVEGLPLQDTRFLNDKDCQKAIRFGDSALKAQLEGYDQIIPDRLEEKRIEGIYNDGLKLKDDGYYTDAIAIFKTIVGLKDATDQIELCKEGIKEDKYQRALAYRRVGDYFKAIESFKFFENYKDAEAQIKSCYNDLYEDYYQNGLAYIAKGNYREAKMQFNTIIRYKDAQKQIKVCNEGMYQNAISLKEKGDYQEALERFLVLSDYKDSNAQIAECEALDNEACYAKALALKKQEHYAQAIKEFQNIKTYKDSKDQIAQCQAKIDAAQKKESKRQQRANCIKSIKTWSLLIVLFLLCLTGFFVFLDYMLLSVLCGVGAGLTGIVIYAKLKYVSK